MRPARFVLRTRSLRSISSKGALRTALATIASGVFALATGCGGPAPTEILQLTDLGPRQVEIGDHVELTGRDFPPPADIRRVTVTFRGALSRPRFGACRAPVEVTVSDPPVGAVTADPSTGGTRELTYAESSTRTLRIAGPNRLEFLMTEALLAQLTACPDQRGARSDDVPHATVSFGAGGRGTSYGVTVRIDGLAGERSITGTLRGPSLDLLAPPARRVALEAPARQPAERTLDFLGLGLAPSHPNEGGLRIATVRPGSPADRAGLLSNDVLVSVDGLTVLSIADVTPSVEARSIAAGVLRNEVREDHLVSLEGLVPVPPTDLVAVAVLLAVAATVLGVLLAPRPASVGWLTHRAGKLLRARGGSVGLRAFVGACLKATRAALDGRLFMARSSAASVAPLLAVGVCASAAVAVPAAPTLLRADMDLWAWYALATAARLLLAMLRGATAPGPFVMREFFTTAAKSAPVAIAAIVALAGSVVQAGTLRTEGVVAVQTGVPWGWLLVRTPASLFLGALFALVLLASGDAAADEAERADRASRPLLDAGLSLLDWAGVLLQSAVFSAAFLGGWLLPGVGFAEQESSVFLQMMGALAWLAKSWLCVGFVLWVRWAAPGLRVAPLFVRGYRALLPGALASLALTLVWTITAGARQGATTSALSTYTLSLMLLLGGGALYRAARGRRSIGLDGDAQSSSPAARSAGASAGTSAGFARSSLQSLPSLASSPGASSSGAVEQSTEVVT